MARIKTYDNDLTISPGDKLIGTDVVDNSTKNFTIAALSAYINGLPNGGGSEDSITNLTFTKSGNRVTLTATRRTGDPFVTSFIENESDGAVHTGVQDPVTAQVVGAAGDFYFQVDRTSSPIVFNAYGPLLQSTDAGGFAAWNAVGPTNLLGATGARGSRTFTTTTQLQAGDNQDISDIGLAQVIDNDLLLVTSGPETGFIYTATNVDRTNPGRATATLTAGGTIRGTQGAQGIGIQTISSPNPLPAAGQPTTISVEFTDPSGNTTPVEQTFQVQAGAQGVQGEVGPRGERGGEWFALIAAVPDLNSIDVSSTAFTNLQQFDILLDGLASSTERGNFYTVQAVTGTPGEAGATARAVLSGNIRGPLGTMVAADQTPDSTDAVLRGITIDGTTYRIAAGGPAPGGRVTSALSIVANVPSGTVLNQGAVTADVIIIPSWTVNTDAVLDSITVTGPGITTPRVINTTTGSGTAFTLTGVDLSVGSNTWTITAVGTDENHMRETETANHTITVTTPRVTARAGFLDVSAATALTDTNIDSFTDSGVVQPNMIVVRTEDDGFKSASYYWVLTARNVNVNVFEDGGGPVAFQTPPVNVMLDGLPYHAYRSTNTQIDRGRTDFNITLTLRYD